MIHPIFLDARPGYAAGGGDATSLLLAPIGDRPLVSVLSSLVGEVGHRARIVTTFEPTAAYVDAVRAASGLGSVTGIEAFHPAQQYEPSDWLLFFDPRVCFLESPQLSRMLQDVVRSRLRATHLISMSRHGGGTSEQVTLDADGRIRRVHRYYDAATWPYLAGVACSLVSAASLGTNEDPPPLGSLFELRGWLAARGVPCRDVPLDAAVFDLTTDRDLLRLNERVLASRREAASEPSAPSSSGATIHPTARLVGQVAVHAGAAIDAGAVVVGPSVIGPGARIGAGATVAQCVLGPEASVAPAVTVRSRAVFGAQDHSSAGSVAIAPDDEAADEPLTVDRPIDRAVYPRVKVAADCIVATVALLVMAPFLVFVALLIKLDSRGPVFFTDLREGRGGRLFRCFKFRTMRQGSHAEQRELMQRNEVDGPQFKLEKDPRITRMGRWLRPSSLDELPQLINVALGDMSLIGPRPSPFRENQTCVPWREARLTVRPGITGLWQVCRHDRPDGDFHQWIYFDLLYVQHLSLIVDMKILLATVTTRGGQSHVPVERIIPSKWLGG